MLSVRGVWCGTCADCGREACGVRREHVVVLHDKDDEATGKKNLISMEIVGSWRWKCWE